MLVLDLVSYLECLVTVTRLLDYLSIQKPSSQFFGACCSVDHDDGHNGMIKTSITISLV